MKRSTTFTTLALASTLALAGCGTSGEESTGAASEASTSTAAGTETTETRPASPSSSAAGAQVSAEHNEADTMFARMMIPHHEQAVQMSQTLLAKDDVPDEVRALAEGVIAAQGPEIQRMQQMLQTWGEPASTESEGAGGMEHGSMNHGTEADADMGGMMSEEDTAALQGAQGSEAARLYLEQMTAHHEGAIQMGREEVADGTNPEAVELAEDVIAAQEAEITEMEQLLQELPDPS